MFSSRRFVVVLLALLIGGYARRADARRWSDNTGLLSVEAELVEVVDNVVVLRGGDGTTTRIPLDALSEKDQEHVRLHCQKEQRQSRLFLGREEEARAKLVRKYGGSRGSEAAVTAALEWLAMHQCRDGGWSFDLRTAPACQGKCGNSGEFGEARSAATGLALLPFLGAGQTHNDGQYQAAVNNGLKFLRTRMKVGAEGGSMWENRGAMYSHGIASIALCEAYAITRDRRLLKPAQDAIDFICYAQDPVAGGWRYSPRQKGDTSVFGWQLQALESAAYLRVLPEVLDKASGYLDTVQTKQGDQYGYVGPGTGHATTAIGLLCRMHLGSWATGRIDNRSCGCSTATNQTRGRYRSRPRTSHASRVQCLQPRQSGLLDNGFSETGGKHG
jgi:hypothetical protein